jgi:hypothetical protein
MYFYALKPVFILTLTAAVVPPRLKFGAVGVLPSTSVIWHEQKPTKELFELRSFKL